MHKNLLATAVAIATMAPTAARESYFDISERVSGDHPSFKLRGSSRSSAAAARSAGTKKNRMKRKAKRKARKHSRRK